MEENISKISPLALKVWNINSCIGIVVWLILSIGLYIGLSLFTEFKSGYILLASSVFFIGVIYNLTLLIKVSELSYESWRFKIENNIVITQRGVFFKKIDYIPISRIQHVSTNQGPIMKKYGLYELVMVTAGGTHSIPCIEEKQAKSLQELIANCAERSKQENEL